MLLLFIWFILLHIHVVYVLELQEFWILGIIFHKYPLYLKLNFTYKWEEHYMLRPETCSQDAPPWDHFPRPFWDLGLFYVVLTPVIMLGKTGGRED